MVSPRLILSVLLVFSCLVSSRASEPLDLGAGRQPQVAISAAGEIVVTFGRDNSIYFTKSTDGSNTFSPASRVAQPKFTPLGMRRGPRIAATKDAIVIAAVVGETGGGKDGDVVAWRTTDGGATWKQSKAINHIAASAREGLIGIAADDESRVFITWLDLRSRKTEIFGALSTDGGKSFFDDVLIYRSPDGHVCECCHPSAAFDGKGNLYVMFRNWLDGNRDMYIARSRDNGRSFDGATKLGQGSWKLNACPMDGGGIAVEDGEVSTTWQRNGEIFVTGITGQERLVGDGKQPVIGGSLIAWIDKQNRLITCSASQGSPIPGPTEAAFPTVSSRGRVTALAWEANGHCFVQRCDPAATHKQAAAQ